MQLSDLYNNVFKPKEEVKSSGFQYSMNGTPFADTARAAGVPQKDTPLYKVPKVIPEKHKAFFIEQARKVGLTPEEFGTIAAREQGANTLAANAKMFGGVDPTDRGVMQVNKLNEPIIQKRFQAEYGKTYNPNSAIDSIIAARMVLEEHRKQFDQMRANQTYTNPYTNRDLIDSYNTGVAGFVKAKKGDPKKVERLTRYQNAGK